MNKELVYICSPLRAETAEGVRNNMLMAEEYAHTISEKYNCRAIAPHSFLPKYLDDSIPKERELGIKFGLDVIKLCKKVYVCTDTISEGMRSEIEFACKFNIPVFGWDSTNNESVKKSL